MNPERIDTPDGYLLRFTASLPQGQLVVTATFQNIMAEDVLPVASWCTLAEAELDGEPVTDPAYAQQLAGQAGIRL